MAIPFGDRLFRMIRTGSLRDVTEFPNGSGVGLNDFGKWVAWWEDGTPLTGDNDELSRFDTRDDAVAALRD